MEQRDKIKAATKFASEETSFLERLRGLCRGLEKKLARKTKLSSKLFLQIQETEYTKMELSAQVLELYGYFCRILIFLLVNKTTVS